MITFFFYFGLGCIFFTSVLSVVLYIVLSSQNI